MSIADAIGKWGSVTVSRCASRPAMEAGPSDHVWTSRYDCGEMQWLWCWRCKCEMPMLGEQDYAEIAALYRTCAQSVKRYREATEASLKSTPLKEIFAPMLN